MLLATIKWRNEFGVDKLRPELVRPNGETGALNHQSHKCPGHIQRMLAKETHMRTNHIKFLASL